MSEFYRIGDKVKWNWGSGTASGEIRAVHTEDVTKTLKGSEITRHASKHCPAYTIEQPDGDLVLKSHSEVRKVS